jgi:two-component system, cell cycle response regulator CpdR
MPTVGILVVDDDRSSQTALRELLDSEGWRVGIVPLASQALPELAGGDWSLVIANISLTGLDGPLFTTLRVLAQAAPIEDGHKRARVLFLVPEVAAAIAQPVLERERLPYVLKPYHLHDFLERVSDLLMETSSIEAPIRHVRPDFAALGASRKLGRAEREKGGQRITARATNMFASREDYQMTEEEIAEYEKQESAESLRRKKKKDPNTGLG